MKIRIVFAAFVLMFGMASADSEPIDPAQIKVIDGDTIKTRGLTYRMIGYDTPEMVARWRKVGPDERAVATIAKERFQELINSGPLDLQPVACSCSKWKVERGLCNHGRQCAILTLNRKNIGDALIMEELAVRYVCGPHKCPKMPDWPRIIESSFR